MTALVRRLCTATLLLLAGGGMMPALAQQASLRGFVTDAADGQTLPGVNVALQSAEGRVFGMATNVNGFYLLTGMTPGRYVLRASYVGYQTRVDTLVLTSGLRHFDIALTETGLELSETTVTSERTTGAASVTAGYQRIRVEDVQLIPAPDISGDLANYLTTLPGVVTSGDQGGQFFIRGGEPTQNLVLLDGIPVVQPFHLLGFYSVFPGELLASADLYAGGYNARYGGRLSSVLDVSARTGNLERFAGSASVSPLVADVTVEGPIAHRKTSLLLSARRSVIAQGAARLTRRAPPFDFGDVLAKLSYAPHASGRFSVTGLYTFDEGALGDSTSPRPDVVRYANAGAGLRYLYLPRNLPLLAEALVSLSELRTSLGPRPDPAIPDSLQSPTRTSRLSGIQADVNLTYSAGRTVLRGGGFAHYAETNSELGGLFANFETARRNEVELGLYAEQELVLGALHLTPGVRATMLMSLRRVFVEPRLRATLTRGVHTFSAATGLYNQFVIGVSDRRDATSVFTAYTITPDERTPRALHLLGGYRVQPWAWFDVAVEGYYKDLRGLSVGEWSAVPELTTRLQPADGEAFGFDARTAVRTAGGAFFSINYGWSRVAYAASQAYYELWYGAETLRFHPPHDRRHQATVVASVPVRGFEVSARWQFGSGLPYSRAFGFDAYAPTVGGRDVYTQEGQPRVIYERPYRGRLPAYHRLDVAVQRAFDLGRARLTAQLGVVNAYDRRNVFAYDVFTLQRVDQLPLIPTFGLRLSTD
ncbi:MAG TPA: TonB-dependent receptor [Rhodothermales bacterium]|nr:TonB-dependent receptor [Rhodothermales bacterium]